MAEKENTLAREAVNIALTQLRTSWSFKNPRILSIRKYRRLYNSQTLPRLRVQFNVPIPVYAGMVDTLQADLNDSLLIKYKNTDPADWKAVQKANAAIRQESESARPGCQWPKKFRQYRFEKIITGRGIMHFSAQSEEGYASNLEVTPFEDFFFEPMGGGSLENHIFAGHQNIWKTKGQLESGAAQGLYDKKQIKKLVGRGGNLSKIPGIWDGYHDIVNRFRPLGLNPDGNNYVGEEVYGLCQWIMEYKGRRWYLLFEPYSGEWIRFEKNSDVNSSDYFPYISSASHEDPKNFASKSFSDDLYPIADSIITLFNQDLTNRQKRLLNARGYDRQMFKDVAKLDEAQYRPDALVPVDTFNGSRRIGDGIYEFKTPDITGGTVNLIDWLQQNAGKNLGVTDLQQGAQQPATKKVGVAYSEMANISKRIDFVSSPFKEAGQQLGERFFVSLKDYMKEPMSVKMLGEEGVEWDVLRRVDLSVKRSFEITVSSQMAKANEDDMEAQNKMKAFTLTAGSPNINTRARDEFIFRDIGKFDEHDISIMLDPSNNTDKETAAEVSAAIQDIVIRGKKPGINHNADRYFVKKLHEFAKKHQDTLSERKFNLLMEYMQEHIQIASQNVAEEVKADVQTATAGGIPGATRSSPRPAQMPAKMPQL